jgi:ankyrin repeat protein
VKDNLGQTPLALAAKKGNVAAVQLLMAHPFVSVNSQDDIGRTPLCIAVKEGHDAVIKVFLECRGVESGIKDAFGRLPLWYSKKSEVTELLSKHLSTVYLETESEHHIHD